MSFDNLFQSLTFLIGEKTFFVYVILGEIEEKTEHQTAVYKQTESRNTKGKELFRLMQKLNITVHKEINEP